MRYIRLLACIALLLSIFTPIACAQNQWCGIQTLFFQHANSPDIPTYEQLINYPSGASETDESIVLKSTSGTVLIDTYISPVGSPDSTMLLKGLRRYRTFSYVDTASGVTRLNFTPFVRYANGTERNLYTVMSDDIDALTVQEYLTSYVSPIDLDLQPETTRLGIRISANTTHSSPVTLHWVYEGTYHYSSVESGFFECPEPPQACCASSSSTESPISPIIPIVAVIGALVFIAYRKK